MYTSLSDQESRRLGADEIAELGRLADELIAGGEQPLVPDELLQKLFTAAVLQYSARYERDPDDYLLPLLADRVTATDVGNCCMEMLRAADMQLFELTMWGSRIPPMEDKE